MASNQDSRASDQYREREAQLIIGLKFHYGKSLKDLPLDVAVDAMVKAWESCQDSENARTEGIMGEQPRRIASPPRSSQGTPYKPYPRF